MHRISWLMLAALLASCGTSDISSEAQAKFDQAVSESAGIEVTSDVSQSTCDDGEIVITGQSRLEAPEVGELYVVITTACKNGTTSSPETAEVVHWSLGAWDSLATIGMSKVNWYVTGECVSAGFTKVACPVTLDPNPTRPETGTLEVVRSDQSFTAEIVYSS